MKVCSFIDSVKSEEVEYPPEMDKRIDYQADDKRQSYSKGDPSQNEKPVDTTPDECANQSMISSPFFSLVSLFLKYIHCLRIWLSVSN